jgi:hypothetical protein
MTDQLTDDARVAQIRRELNPNADRDDAFREYDAAELAKDEAEANELGIPVHYLQAARKHGMDPHEYALFAGGASNASQASAFEAEAAKRREAREEAQHQRLVELAKRKLAGE